MAYLFGTFHNYFDLKGKIKKKVYLALALLLWPTCCHNCCVVPLISLISQKLLKLLQKLFFSKILKKHLAIRVGLSLFTHFKTLNENFSQLAIFLINYSATKENLQ